MYSDNRLAMGKDKTEINQNKQSIPPLTAFIAQYRNEIKNIELLLLTKFNSKIPLTQAAYIKGRSTTEHVFAMKILCDKAIISCDCSVHILLLDMTKAFDTTNKEHLYRLLSEFHDPDELNINEYSPERCDTASKK